MIKPGLFTRALAALYLAVLLTVILFIGWKLAGLAFAPFTLFDWISRLLPGAVITFGIDSMVKVIRFFNLGNTAIAAKTAEQTIAVIIFVTGGIIAGTLVFSTLHRLKKHMFIPGMITGLILGLIIVFIDLSLSQFSLINELWIILLFIAWGYFTGWVYTRIAMPVPGEKKPAPSVKQLDRRSFLIRLGGASAAFVVTGAVVDLITRKKREDMNESWSAHNKLPNVGAEVEPAPGTRPEFTSLENHYRIDINTMPPVIDEEKWRLKITGLVENPLALTLQKIKNYAPINQFITLACISNPVGGDLIGTTRWTGTSLQNIIPDMKLKPGAAFLNIKSADGFFESIPIDLIKKDSRIMLTYAWDGLPLETKHGFPLRIYIPDHYGMKQPKWIESIEVSDEWQAGYWVVRGWDREAVMKATSVIDTVAVTHMKTGADGRKLIPVGGIAHAGDRGISKVELSIDRGDWQPAKLRTPLSGLTWVIWRFDMPFMEGVHTLTVRCSDGNGTPQIITHAPPHPSGASGLDSRKFRT